MNNDICPICTNKYKETSGNTKEREKLFNILWSIYPKKINKNDAMNEFMHAEFDNFDLLITSVKKSILSDEWLQEGGKYIPSLATWISKQKWLDTGIDYKAINDAKRQEKLSKHVDLDKYYSECRQSAAFQWRLEFRRESLPSDIDEKLFIVPDMHPDDDLSNDRRRKYSSSHYDNWNSYMKKISSLYPFNKWEIEMQEDYLDYSKKQWDDIKNHLK